MNNDGQARLMHIFRQVIDADEADRDAMIDDLCRDDPSIERDLRSLLSLSSESTEELLRRLEDEIEAQGVKEPVETSQMIGRVINDAYEIRAEIGRGGMGVVFEAFHRPLGRIVALKVLSWSLAAPDMVRRFQHEAAILGMLQHPGIARVYEVGVWNTDTGPHPYIAMERIDGVPLNLFIERERPDLPTRLRLMIDICEAVHHAHQRGVIHRDLKPANILVDNLGRPHLLDFGVARLLQRDETDLIGLTMAGQMLGTLSYMSPEQLVESADRLTVCTDVYSLGALCYEVLSGRPAIDCRQLSVIEAAHHIRRHHPDPPTFAGNPIASDLATVIAKAMEKSPDDRYPSAHELAADLRRYLRDEPVHACPPSRLYQMRKFARRYRTAVAAVACMLLLLLASLATVTTLYIQTEQARSEAVAARDAASTARAEEEHMRRLAEANERQAQEAMERAVAAESTALQRADDLQLTVAFQASQLKDIETEFMGVTIRRGIVDKRRAALKAQDFDEHEIERQIDELDNALAGINFTSVALKVLEQNVFDRSIQAIDQTFHDQPRIRVQLLQTVADTLLQLGMSERAMEVQIDTLNLARQELGNDDGETLTAVTNMGVTLHHLGRFQEAIEHFEQAADGFRELYGEDHEHTFNALNNIAGALAAQGRLDEAEPMINELVSRTRDALGAEHRQTLIATSLLASLLMGTGRLEDAAQLLTETLEVRRRTLGEDHPETIESYAQLGLLFQQQGDLERAEHALRTVLDRRQRMLGEQHPATLQSMSNLAALLRVRGQMSEAEKYYQTSLETSRRLYGENHPITVRTMNNMGALLSQQGHLAEAEQQYRAGLEAARRLYGEDHPRTITSINNVGSMLQRQGKHAEAEPFLREALAYHRRSSHERPNLIVAINNLAAVLRELGELEEAASLGSEAVDLARRMLPADHWHLAVFASQYAQTLEALQRFDEAEQLAIEAHAIFKASLGESHERTINAVRQVARLYNAWHAAAPENGYDREADRWQEKLLAQHP